MNVKHLNKDSVWWTFDLNINVGQHVPLNLLSSVTKALLERIIYSTYHSFSLLTLLRVLTIDNKDFNQAITNINVPLNIILGKLCARCHLSFGRLNFEVFIWTIQINYLDKKKSQTNEHERQWRVILMQCNIIHINIFIVLKQSVLRKLEYCKSCWLVSGEVDVFQRHFHYLQFSQIKVDRKWLPLILVVWNNKF